MRNRRTSVRFPVFNGYEVRVILSRDVQRTGRGLKVDLTGCAAAWVRIGDFPRRGWLVLAPDVDAGTIAHEASHAVRSMLAYVGAKNEDEVFAYHLDYLVGRIHRFLER